MYIFHDMEFEDEEHAIAFVGDYSKLVIEGYRKPMSVYYEESGNRGDPSKYEHHSPINWSDVMDWVETALDKLKIALTGDIAALKTKVVDWIEDAVESVLAFFSVPLAKIKETIDLIKQTISKLVESIRTAVQKVINWAISTFEIIVDKMGEALEAIKEWFKVQWAEFTQFVKDVKDWVSTAFNTAITWLGNSLKKLWETIKAGFDWIADKLKKGYDAAIAWALEAFKKIGETIGQVVKDVWAWFTGIVEKIAEWIREQARTFAKGFDEWITESHAVALEIHEEEKKVMAGVLEFRKEELINFIVDIVKAQHAAIERIAKEVI